MDLRDGKRTKNSLKMEDVVAVWKIIFFHRQVTNAGYTFNNASERYCIKDDESLGTADFLLSNSFSENQLKKKKKKSACKKLSLISKKRPFYNISNADGFEDSKLKRVCFK